MRYVRDGKLDTFSEDGFDSLEARVQRLEDLRSIEELVTSYTRFADLADPEGMAACFAENGVLRWTPSGPPEAVGRETLRGYFRHAVGRSRTQEHFCTDFQLRFTSRGSAVGVCNMLSWQIWKDDSKPWTVCSGKYEFAAVKEDGRWLLSSLCLTLNAKIERHGIAGGREREQFGRPWPPEALGGEV